MNPVCVACSSSVSQAACVGAFGRLGIASVHWECWSACNLSCQFCYRTKTAPLGPEDGIALVGSVAASGARRIVFAGGDPSLRRDLPRLVEVAKAVGLQVEIQTNAHVLTPAILDSLPLADGVGVSLDGPTPAVHDAFRQKPGNFEQVISLLQRLNGMGTPTTVRSVVAKENHESIASIEPLLRQFTNIRRWSLIQFTPLGDGFLSGGRYLLEPAIFERVAASVGERMRDWPILDTFRDNDKIGTYALISSDGTLYGVSASDAGPSHQTAGSMLRNHLDELASRLPFSASNHRKRYHFQVLQEESRR